MALPLGGAGPSTVAGAGSSPKVGGGGERFGKVLDQAKGGSGAGQSRSGRVPSGAQ